ncbi:MAG: 23S rRNA (guanosine(2251)-2'-O)-methyltransferase RlmB [Bacteroidales bacterium]
MEKSDREFIFGIRSVIEAIRAGKLIDRLLLKREGRGSLYHELLGEAKDNNIPVQFVPAEKIDSITRKNHQGVIAWLSAVEYQNIANILPSIFENGEDPLILILDGISDVRNFGAIIRSADCLGVHAVVIPERGSVRAGADAVKTSAGALLNFPVCREKSLTRTVEFLRSSGLAVAGASEKADTCLYEAGIAGPLAIVLGSEDRGISRELESLCDMLIRIPMSGKTGSLNVSVAAGIILYEVSRQRNLT